METGFREAMNSAGAAADSDWIGYRKYDANTGDLLERYLNWRTPDGTLAGRIEQYYAHGEMHYLHVVFDDDSLPDTATAAV